MSILPTTHIEESREWICLGSFRLGKSVIVIEILRTALAKGQVISAQN